MTHLRRPRDRIDRRGSDHHNVVCAIDIDGKLSTFSDRARGGHLGVVGTLISSIQGT
jgi:hypothetical protein